MHIWRHPMLTPTNLFSAFFLQVHNDSVITFGLLTFLWFCKCVEHCLNQALNVFKTNAINTSFRKRPGSLKNYFKKYFEPYICELESDLQNQTSRMYLYFFVFLQKTGTENYNFYVGFDIFTAIFCFIGCYCPGNLQILGQIIDSDCLLKQTTKQNSFCLNSKHRWDMTQAHSV